MMNVKVKHHKIARPTKRKRMLLFWRRWWVHLLALVLLALIPLAKRAPGVVELIYARVWYPAVARTYGALTSLLPFSLTEVGIAALAVTALVLLIREIRYCWRADNFGRLWRNTLFWGTRGICALLSLFMLFCGYNYYRVPFAEACGLSIHDSPLQELSALCGELAGQANTLRAGLPEDDLGVMYLSERSLPLAWQARREFRALAEQYDVLPAYPITPKPVLNSWAMSLMQITGVFCPVTFEANVNIDAPDYGIPTAMCHELAHTRGHMREDEANFIAFLACRESDSPEFQYSGVMLALSHAMSRLAAADSNLYWALEAQLSEGVRRDFRYNAVYWAKFETAVGDVSTAVNNAYLQLNDQSDGVHSYGRMVDLLLADYRARHGEA